MKQTYSESVQLAALAENIPRGKENKIPLSSLIDLTCNVRTASSDTWDGEPGEGGMRGRNRTACFYTTQYFVILTVT